MSWYSRIVSVHNYFISFRVIHESLRGESPFHVHSHCNIIIMSLSLKSIFIVTRAITYSDDFVSVLFCKNCIMSHGVLCWVPSFVALWVELLDLCQLHRPNDPPSLSFYLKISFILTFSAQFKASSFPLPFKATY